MVAKRDQLERMFRVSVGKSKANMAMAYDCELLSRVIARCDDLFAAAVQPTQGGGESEEEMSVSEDSSDASLLAASSPHLEPEPQPRDRQLRPAWYLSTTQ